MKKIFAVAALVLLASSGLASQAEKQSSSSASASARADAKASSQAKAQPGKLSLDAGSQIQAEMNSTLDLKKAKPGDKFKMKTARAVKRDGREVISRGSTITGHVEQVVRADNTIRATLIFDEIQDKKTGLATQIDAVVTAVTRAQHNVSSMANDDTMATPAPAPRSQGGQQSGGLLGGVVNTVGGTVDATAKGTLGATTGVGNATGGLAGGAIQIVTDTTANVTSGSTLAVADRNTKIESGTQFILQTTSALTFSGQREKKNKE
ncbi:MAG TPA: hypothetical protein VNN73_03930 [Blastocatellia bacterium]|nr:hypothetical protein [Blastocatellia bacterium]